MSEYSGNVIGDDDKSEPPARRGPPRRSAISTSPMRLHGGYGYLKDYSVERMMGDARVMQIRKGANQIQRLLIAKETHANH